MTGRLKILILLLSITYSIGHTQSKKAIKYFEIGTYEMGLNKFDIAISNFQKAIDLYPAYKEAKLRLADVYFKSRDYKNALAQFEALYNEHSLKNNALLLMLSESAFEIQEYDKCLKYVSELLDNENISAKNKSKGILIQQNANFAKKAVKTPVSFQPVNLGANINTEHDEYLPAISADFQKLVFTKQIDFQEDLYYSIKENDQWVKAKSAGPTINTGHNEGAHCLTDDGKLILYTACNMKNSLGSCDIYFTKLSKGKWTPPKNISKPINSPHWEAQPSFSSDKKHLYFVSNRPGGYGGKDIWVVHLQKDKTWSTPENLGPTINTPFDEQSPFIHFDGQTLYFSSKGHPGMGKEDIFVSKLKKNKWSKPINLGYPINTADVESGLGVTIDGSKAFYASNRSDSYGGLDIYSFELPDYAKPELVTYVSGKTINKATGEPVKVLYEIYNLTTGEIIEKNKTSSTGSFFTCLPLNANYGLTVADVSFLPYSKHFALSKHPAIEPIQLNIELSPIKQSKNTAIVLSNVFFKIDSHELEPTSFIELNEIASTIKKGGHKVEISGHTDNTGSKSHNQALSQNRAQSVVNYLVQQGVYPDKLIAIGYGDTIPIADNSNEEGRAKNRRTEFKIID